MKLASLMDLLLEIAGRPDVDPDEMEVVIPGWDTTSPLVFNASCAPVFVMCAEKGAELKFTSTNGEPQVVSGEDPRLLCLCLNPDGPLPVVTH